MRLVLSKIPFALEDLSNLRGGGNFRKFGSLAESKFINLPIDTQSSSGPAILPILEASIELLFVESCSIISLRSSLKVN